MLFAVAGRGLMAAQSSKEGRTEARAVRKECLREHGISWERSTRKRGPCPSLDSELPVLRP